MRAEILFIRLSPGLVIKSSWRPHRPRPGERALRIKAGRAFPPSHPTTRLCLELLVQTLEKFSGKRLLDVGCGSGILALAGAALGAGLCVGVDLSRQAVQLSRKNARENRLADVVPVAQGSTECLRGPFAALAANLPAAVQLDKVEEFARLAAPGAVLILSGFKDTQEEPLASRYRQAGWSIGRRLTKDEWVIELPPEKSFTWTAWQLERRSCLTC